MAAVRRITGASPDAARAIRSHRLLFGDWHPWLRDPLDLLRLAFLAGAIAGVALGDTETAVRMALTFVVTLAARRLDLPRPLDLAVIVGMALQAFGNAFGLFNQPWHYDKVVHFVLPAAVAPTVYVLLIRLALVPDLADRRTRAHPAGIAIVTLGLGMTVGVVYELYEYFAVNVLHAGLHVGYGDTIGDLLDDGVGSLIGGLLLMVWQSRGWGSVRRVHAPPR